MAKEVSDCLIETSGWTIQVDIQRVIVGSKNKAKTLITNTTFELKQGEWTAILGPSGAGKSTLMKWVGGVHDANVRVQGSIYIVDCNAATRVVYGEARRQKSIAYVGTNDAWPSHLRVRDVVRCAAKLNQTDSRDVNWCHREFLAQCWDTMCGDISSGERRRLSVVCGVLRRPKLILLDEPTTGLSDADSVRMMRLIRRVITVKNITVCAVLHQPRSLLIESIHSFLVLHQQKIVLYGSHKSINAHCDVRGVPENGNSSQRWLDYLEAVSEETLVGAELEEIKRQRNQAVSMRPLRLTPYELVAERGIYCSESLSKVFVSLVAWTKRDLIFNQNHWRQHVGITLLSALLAVMNRLSNPYILEDEDFDEHLMIRTYTFVLILILSLMFHFTPQQIEFMEMLHQERFAGHGWGLTMYLSLVPWMMFHSVVIGLVAASITAYSLDYESMLENDFLGKCILIVFTSFHIRNTGIVLARDFGGATVVFHLMGSVGALFNGYTVERTNITAFARFITDISIQSHGMGMFLDGDGSRWFLKYNVFLSLICLCGTWRRRPKFKS